MKLTARIQILILAASLFSASPGNAASSIKDLPREGTHQTQPLAGFGATPGIYTNFNPRNIPELQGMRVIPDLEYSPPQVSSINDGSHRVTFFPASQVRPPERGTSIPIVDRVPQGYRDISEWEDQRAFSSNLYTDTTLYLNWISDNQQLSSKNEGGFYKQNIRYDLFTTRNSGDSLSLTFDTTHCNDKRSYNEGFTLNQINIESRTPKTLLSFGHAYPDMSDFTVTQQILGLYGVHRFDNIEISGFAGYRAVEKNDLKNPRNVGGIRIEHVHDESVIIGLTAVGTKDAHENPGAAQDLPTIANTVYAMDILVQPYDHIKVKGEYAGSDTDFDRRTGLGNREGQAFRFSGLYGKESYSIEAGVEQGDTDFLTPLGESPRDEIAFFGRLSYVMNRYFSARISGRASRDNLANYKRATIIRNMPEFQITIRPSDYYKDLRLEMFYQPMREYSNNGDFVDRYRDLAWFELTQRAGAFDLFAVFANTGDKDKITPANDRNINRLDLKLTWEYNNFNALYSSFSFEEIKYVRTGGADQVRIYGWGGRSSFREDIDLHLDYTHEENTITDLAWDSRHNRLALSMTKEYNNLARLILYLEGSQNYFRRPGRDFTDISAKLRFLRSF